MTWTPETFSVAWASGPHTVTVYTYRGLGLHMLYSGSPTGRMPGRWSLTHLNTGHRLAIIDGNVATAFPIAFDIAEAGDWDFLSLGGYKDKFPDALEQLEKIAAQHPKHLSLTQSKSPNLNDRSHAVAQQIASNRP